MRINFQQGVITYPISGNQQSFLKKTGVYVSISTTNGRTDVAFAHGNSNYILTEASDVNNAWGPIPTSTDVWLYWNIDTQSAIRTFGYTLLEPTCGTTRPSSPSNGQHFFNTTEKKMYVYESGSWRNVIRVFAAKLNNSTFSPMGTGTGLRPYAGTQVGLNNISTSVGRILVDDTGKPVRRSTGTFFTTEDDIFVNGSPVNTIRLEANVLTATAQENMSEYQVAYFSDFGKINVATYDQLQDNMIVMLMESLTTGATGTVITQGTVTNPAWNFENVGATLWVDGSGVLVEVDPHVSDSLTYPQSKPPIGRVIASDTIFFDQGLGGIGPQGLPGPEAIVEVATPSVAGIVKLSVTSTTPDDPVVVGDNDPRMTDARIPLAHTQAGTTVTFTPYGTITASDVEVAIRQLENNKVKKSGDTMTGYLTLHANPTNALHAATKQYVDSMTLDGLNDVTFVGSAATNDVLLYNGTTWTNSTLSLDNLSDVDVSSVAPVSGDILQYNGSDWIAMGNTLGSLSDVTTNVDNTVASENAWLRYDYVSEQWLGEVGQPYDAHFFMPSKASGIAGVVMGAMVVPREVTFTSDFVDSVAKCITQPVSEQVVFTLNIDGAPWVDITFTPGSYDGVFDSSPYSPPDYIVPAGSLVTIVPQANNSEIEDVMITLVGCTTKLICPLPLA